MTLCNMSIEMGAKTGIVPADEKTFKYLKGRAREEFVPVYADKDAKYCREFIIDVGDLEPQIAKPHEVDNVAGVGTLLVHHLTRFHRIMHEWKIRGPRSCCKYPGRKESESQDNCASCIAFCSDKSN